jgi:RNA polymerase subunit RPABC4/transcription elongation factor Spt4
MLWEGAAVTTRTCPLCGGRQFFMNPKYPAGGVLIGVFKNIAFYNLVCLACGSVSQTLDDVGLEIIRELAEKSEVAAREKPGEQVEL